MKKDGGKAAGTDQETLAAFPVKSLGVRDASVISYHGSIPLSIQIHLSTNSEENLSNIYQISK